MSKPLPLGKYLLDQLARRGVKHVFGVPGDYVLRFYDLIEQSPLRHIGTTREDAAGFAADAYARVRGLGAVCVTYCVGGLNLANPVAGAVRGEIAGRRDQRRAGAEGAGAQSAVAPPGP